VHYKCCMMMMMMISSDSQRDGNHSIMISDQVGENLVCEPSYAGRGSQNSTIVPLTAGSSIQLDLDCSILTTTAWSTSAPLHTDDSTVTRTMPSPSTSTMNVEQHTSLSCS